MKKIFSILLVSVMLISSFLLSGCSGGNVKMGLGVYSVVTSLDADGDSEGKVEGAYTFAAVLLDKNGKILNCTIDASDVSVTFDSKGKVNETEAFSTKNELGADYGMVAYGGSAKEWNEQAKAFADTCKGKTLDEVKALVAEDGKGTEEVIGAGCTISVADFVKAVEKAVGAAKDSTAGKKDTLNVGVVSTQSSRKDASDEGAGVGEITVNVVATAVKGGKVTAVAAECAVLNSSIDETGTVVGTKETYKYELGADYGMVAYGTDLNGDGKVLEYFEQIDVLNSKMVGKTADEISALAAENGYGSADVQTAGCTISISDMVKAAVKAAKAE